MKKRKQKGCGLSWFSSSDWEWIKFCLLLDIIIKAIVFSILYICDVI